MEYDKILVHCHKCVSFSNCFRGREKEFSGAHKRTVLALTGIERQRSENSFFKNLLVQGHS